MEKPEHHLCVTDELSGYFRGRRTLLQPLFQNMLAKLNRFNGITVQPFDQLIAIKSSQPFAYVHIGDGSIDVFVDLPQDKPISPNLKSANRLQVGKTSHYFTIKSVADLTPDIMHALMWAKEKVDYQQNE